MNGMIMQTHKQKKIKMALYLLAILLFAWLMLPVISFAEGSNLLVQQAQEAVKSKTENLTDAMTDTVKTAVGEDKLNAVMDAATPEVPKFEAPAVAIAAPEVTAPAIKTSIIDAPVVDAIAAEIPSAPAIPVTPVVTKAPVVADIPVVEAVVAKTPAVKAVVEKAKASNSNEKLSTSIEVTKAHAKPTLKGQEVGAAYVSLRNLGDKAVALVGATTYAAKRVEIHVHTQQGGVAKMRKLSRLDVMPKQEQVMESGGLHLMLFELKKPLVEGKSFKMKLKFSDDSTKTVTVKVSK